MHRSTDCVYVAVRADSMHRSQACADLRKNVDSENTQVLLLDVFRRRGALRGDGGDGVVVVAGVGQGEAGGVVGIVCGCVLRGSMWWKRGVTGACLPPPSAPLLLLFLDLGLHLQAKAQPHPRRAEPPQGLLACRLPCLSFRASLSVRAPLCSCFLHVLCVASVTPHVGWSAGVVGPCQLSLAHRT